MSKKALGILSLIAGIFVVLAIVGQAGRNTAPIAGDSVGQPLIAGLAANLDDVDELLITGAGEQRLVTLERRDDGWSVAELGGYAAERSVINALLIALADARIVEEKTADPAFHSRLGLEDIGNDEAQGIELTLTSPAASFAIVLGDAYTGGQRYARLADSNQTVLIDQNPDIATALSEWVDPEIIDIAGDRVQRVEISHADGERLTLSKATPDDPDFAVLEIPEGRELQYSGVANVTGNLLEGLRLDDVAPRPEALEDPTSTSEFFTFDGLVVSVMAHPADADTTWLTFDARYDDGQAQAFRPAAEDGDEDGDEADAPAGGDPADISAAAREEAAALATHLADWQYRIPSYQVSQLARRVEDLLSPAAAE